MKYLGVNLRKCIQDSDDEKYKIQSEIRELNKWTVSHVHGQDDTIPLRWWFSPFVYSQCIPGKHRFHTGGIASNIL
jgi:hypothetical protein